MIAKYQRWYDQIITRGHDRQLDEYSERHHILPRSLGGGDEETNLVTLTYREHFLAHWLLTKIYDGDAKRPMVYALHCMSWSLGGRLISGWQVDTAKRAVRLECQKRAAARMAAWKAAKLKARTEAFNTIEASKENTQHLSTTRDSYRIGAIANHWLNAKGIIRSVQRGPGNKPLAMNEWKLDPMRYRRSDLKKDR